MLALTDADFNRLHTYIKANYGIDLSKKKQLIVSRLSNTLASRGYRSFSEYVDEILTGRDKEMVTSMLNKLTTNYTYFLREEAHFQFLQNTVLPDLAKKHARDKTLSIWSAGCSSGEEPYTISMYLKYFVKNKDNTYTIAPVIKQNVIFQTFNLMNPIRFRRPFDLIFCRNVMIYFDQATKDALVQRFYDATVPGGYLLIGHSEGLNKAACPYEYLMPAIYQKTRR